MVITIIDILLIIGSLIFLILIFKNRNFTHDYDFKTSISPFYRNVCLILYIVSIILFSASIILDITGDNFSFIPLILGLFFLFVAVYGLYSIYYTYEAIKDDKVIIKRLKVIEIDCKDISAVIFTRIAYIFFDNNGIKLFSVDSSTNGISEFINKIKTKNLLINTEEHLYLKLVDKETSKINIICISFLLIICLVFNISFGFLFTQKPNQLSDFEEVCGKVEYVTLVNSKYDYIAISLEGKTPEYRISSIYADSVKEILEGTISKGDMLYLYILTSDEEQKATSEVDESKTTWTYAYMVRSDSIEYLTYDEYVYEFTKNIDAGKTLCIVMAVLEVGFLIALIKNVKRYKTKIERR